MHIGRVHSTPTTMRITAVAQALVRQFVSLLVGVVRPVGVETPRHLSSGIIPVAIGYDGGGSIRVPCSMSGIYGLSTTFGRIPFVSTITGSTTMVHCGPMAGSARVRPPLLMSCSSVVFIPHSALCGRTWHWPTLFWRRTAVDSTTACTAQPLACHLLTWPMYDTWTPTNQSRVQCSCSSWWTT